MDATKCEEKQETPNKGGPHRDGAGLYSSLQTRRGRGQISDQVVPMVGDVRFVKQVFDGVRHRGLPVGPPSVGRSLADRGIQRTSAP